GAIRCDRRRWIESPRGAGKRLVGFACHEQSHPGRGFLCHAPVDKRRTSLRTGEDLDILAVVEKGHIVRPSGLKRRDIPDRASGIRSALQLRSAQRCQRFQRERPGTIEEAGIRHRRLRRVEPRALKPYFFFFAAAGCAAAGGGEAFPLAVAGCCSTMLTLRLGIRPSSFFSTASGTS